MLYAGLDLSRQRLDAHALDEEGRTVEATAVRPDADALRTLVARISRHGQEVSPAIESIMLTKNEPFAPGRPPMLPLVACRPSTEMGRRSIRSNLVLPRGGDREMSPTPTIIEMPDRRPAS